MSDDKATAEKEINAILEKHGLKMGYNITFPVYAQLPEEVQLALKILAKHEMRVLITIEPK